MDDQFAERVYQMKKQETMKRVLMGVCIGLLCLCLVIAAVLCLPEFGREKGPELSGGQNQESTAPAAPEEPGGEETAPTKPAVPAETCLLKTEVSYLELR